MRRKHVLFVLILTICAALTLKAQDGNYLNNRHPLHEKPFMELPLGNIKAKGWLEEMLKRQVSGATLQMDKLYPQVMGPRNGWLGGDGDQWERGPYWIDGLLPLAYILDNEELKEKAQPWIEWALQSQDETGFFGPKTDYPREPGIQRTNSKDWWPRMVVLKILQQYYSATNDERVVEFMTSYFKYQLKTLPDTPLGNWTFWAEYRACDNLDVVYWLYNITGEKFLLDLGKLLHKQSYDYVEMFTNRNDLTRINTIHCVNLAQGIKEPVIYYQQDRDQKYIDAVKKAFSDIKQFHGQPQGMYGGDEALHGNNPTQGSELCSAVELMFSLENMVEITGDIQFAEHLERIAFNALPTQIADDFMSRQYFQQANQVMVSRTTRNFDINHGETDLLFGLLTGYPCCTSNMHQGWPKFTQNLWYATPDKGLAAMIYSPSEVTAKVGDGTQITITEETNYPMDDEISFKMHFSKEEGVHFPLHLRIPSWTKNAEIRINGEKVLGAHEPGSMKIVQRKWKDGDVVTLKVPMKIAFDTWYENAVAIERGPLVYALKMEENWVKKKDTVENLYGDFYYEVLPGSDWNYGLMKFEDDEMDKVFKVVIDEEKVKSNYPWNLENAPIEIKARAKKIPQWKLYNDMAGPQPYSNMIYGFGIKDNAVEEITLIPYGCTTLRITEFPVIE